MIKLADTLEPMADFPSAYAKDIAFNDGDTLQEKLDTGSLGGGASYTQLSQAEYDALTEEEKMNGKEYRTYDTGHIYKLGVEYGKDAYFTSLSQLGLDTTATLKDITRAMAKGSIIALKVDAMADQSEYNNITQGTVTIHKVEDARVQAIMTNKVDGRTWVGALGSDNTIIGWQEIATKDNLIVQTVSNSSSATDKVPSANIMARELFGNNISDTSMNILELGAGQWKVDSNAKASSLQNMPVARAGKLYVIHLQGNDGLTPYTSAYKYAMYKYITIDGVEYIRSLNSDGTVGHIVNDTGWKQIATKSTYNSVAELNRAKGTNIELVNGEDNTQKIVDALSVGEQFISFYHNNANQNRFGIDVSYGNLIHELRITKCLDADLTANYATVTAFMNTGCVMSRIYYKTYPTDWSSTKDYVESLT